MRRPLFFAALALLAFAFLLEVGSGFLLEPASQEVPPGFGIRALALIDGLLLLSLGLLVLAMFVPHSLHGRLAGIVSLVGGVVVILLSLALLVSAATSLTLMLALLLGGFFSQLAYAAQFGAFDRTGASVLMGVVLACKIGYVVLALSAYPRFAGEKALVALTLTSFGTLLLVSFLHGMVPLLFVSILDALAAIIVAVVAIIWTVIWLLRSLTSIIQVLRVRRS